MKYIPYNHLEKIRIAFLYQVASFWPSWESLYFGLLQDKRFEVKLYYLHVEGLNCAQTETAERFLKEKKIAYEEYEESKIKIFAPHYLMVQTPYDKGHRKLDTWTYRFKIMGIRIVYIPYGIEISDTPESRFKHFSMSVVMNANLIYVMSDEIKKEYEKYCFNAQAVRAYGLPRFDSLWDKKSFQLSTQLKVRIRGRKIVLWKAHFPKVFIENGIKKQATPKLEEYLKFVDYIQKMKDIFFIFMPHPKFVDSTIDDDLRPKAQRLLESLERMENVYIDYADDYRYSLLNAEAIIVDRSAVMVEAGIMGVPVLYMFNADYYEPMIPPVQRLIDKYERGSTAEEMERFVDSFREGHNRIDSLILPLDRGCSRKIVDSLAEEITKQEEDMLIEILPEKAKIIFWGTGDIWKYIKANTPLKQFIEKIDIVAFTDNSVEKQGKTFEGIDVISPLEINDFEYDYIVIASDIYHDEIQRQLTKSLLVPANKILSYDVFLVLSNTE